MIEVIKGYSAFIESVHINYRESNITVIRKRNMPEALFYEDWNVIEGRESWKQGFGDIPNEEQNNLKKQTILAL